MYARYRPRKPLPILARQGAPEAVIERYRRKLDKSLASDDVRDALREELRNIMTDPRVMHVAATRLMRYGGDAPGPDGIRLREIRLSTQWELWRALSEAIRKRAYRPASTRKIKIPKGGDRGHRQLELSNVSDRVVARAAVEILSPWLDPMFSSASYGFRPRRSTLHALADAMHVADREDRWVWLANDLERAFDRVPVQRLRDVVREELGGPVDQVVGMIVGKRKRGIPQGSPLSPLLLNVYLDKFLDRPWRRSRPEFPLLRYADDLLVLCQTRKRAGEAAGELTRLLTPAGMRQKFETGDAIYDIRRRPIDWLGYYVRRQGDSFVTEIGDSAWAKLEISLQSARREADAVRRSYHIVHGWLNYLGPCFRSDRVARVTECIGAVAHRAGFEEPPPRRKVAQWWTRAFQRWEKVRSAAG